MTPTEAKELLANETPLTPAQWLALFSFLASVGLAYVLEDRGIAGLDRDAIFDRAEELFDANDKSLAAHIEEYRSAQQPTQ